MRTSLVVFLSAAMLACGPPTGGSNNGGGNQRGAGSECAVNTECDPNKQCENGYCVEASGCTNSADCEAGERCIDGACSGGSSCTDMRDCPEGQLCERNQCVPRGATCTADRDCERGETCANGRCRAGDGTCTTEQDCPNGQTCRNGQCITTAGGDDCLRDRDCPAGQICDSGSCVPEGSCTTDRDCALGEACINGQCSPAGGGGGSCTTHAQCPDMEICVQPAGRCERLLDQLCNGDSECAFDDGEGNSIRGVCEQGRCKMGQFGDCTAGSDCGSEFTCTRLTNGSMCLKECQDNSVCDSHLKCDLQGNRCWYNLCGSPNELSPGFREVNNGRLGGSCNADGINDGTCIEVSAGDNEWVGLCIEGGTAAVGSPCLFETTRNDNANQCVGGAVCHFADQRMRGACVSSCASEGEHGTVRCAGGTRCMAGRCLSPSQYCNPGTRDNCGPNGRCVVYDWEDDNGFCAVQERNTVAIGGACEDNAQCADGSACLGLVRGQPSTCVAICRPQGGGEACPNGTTCMPLSQLSGGQIAGNWGLCASQ